jgi:hypothetical protein
MTADLRLFSTRTPRGGERGESLFVASNHPPANSLYLPVFAASVTPLFAARAQMAGRPLQGERKQFGER